MFHGIKYSILIKKWSWGFKRYIPRTTLLPQKDNLQKKKKIINENSQKIKLLEKEINDIENDKGKLNKKLLEERMLNVNNELNNILIDNKNEFKQIQKLK